MFYFKVKYYLVILILNLFEMLIRLFIMLLIKVLMNSCWNYGNDILWIKYFIDGIDFI